MSIFNLMSNAIDRQQQEHGLASSPAGRFLVLSDLWQYRKDYQNEKQMQSILNHAARRRYFAVQEREQRAEHIAQTYVDTILKLIDGGTGHSFITISEEGAADLRRSFVQAAKFDFMGINLDEVFDLLEFTLTHEKPLFIYEVIDWHIDTFIDPINSASTAKEKIEVFKQAFEAPRPDIVSMTVDAYALAMSEYLRVMSTTEFGYVTLESNSEDVAAPVGNKITDAYSGHNVVPEVHEPAQAPSTQQDQAQAVQLNAEHIQAVQSAQAAKE